LIGSRARGRREPSSMNFQQIFAGRLVGWLMSIMYGVRYTDMCPFRAIRRDALDRLAMKEETYGWNLEMQMKAARAGLRILEVPVNHRRRAGGVSKVSGTLRGTFVAGARIIATFARTAVARCNGGSAAPRVRSEAYEQIDSSLGRIAVGPHRRNRHASRDVGPRLLWRRDAACDHRRSAFGFY